MEDIFDEDGALTAVYLMARGYCCALECKNCPYVPRHGGLESVLPAPAGGRDEAGSPAERSS